MEEDFNYLSELKRLKKVGKKFENDIIAANRGLKNTYDEVAVVAHTWVKEKHPGWLKESQAESISDGDRKIGPSYENIQVWIDPEDDSNDIQILILCWSQRIHTWIWENHQVNQEEFKL